jgi:hypothetical protein
MMRQLGAHRDTLCSAALRILERGRTALSWARSRGEGRSTDVTNQPEIRIGCKGPQASPSNAGRPISGSAY